MATDRTSVMLERLVGLPAITVLDVEQHPLRITIETKLRHAERCAGCGAMARVKDRDPVELTDRSLRVGAGFWGG